MRIPKVMDAAKFKTLSEELKTIAGLLPQDVKIAEWSKKSPVLCGWNGTGNPEFLENEIAFNGDKTDDMDHESFVIQRDNSKEREDEKGLIFEFCKSARKPYDLMVKISMLRLKHHFPKTEISCDGDASDWKQARTIYKKAFGENGPRLNR
jgi:hypothetical protein